MAVNILAILSVAAATVAANRSMIPRFERKDRIWFYVVGVLLSLVPASLWTWANRRDPRPICAAWASFGVAGATTLANRWLTARVDRFDRELARQWTLDLDETAQGRGY